MRVNTGPCVRFFPDSRLGGDYLRSSGGGGGGVEGGHGL